MLKILSGSDVGRLDAFHTGKIGISSHQLMERAASGFVTWFLAQGISANKPIGIFCGSGNNGGDGLAIARLLHKNGYPIHVFTCFSPDSALSADCQKNLELLPSEISFSHWEDFQGDTDMLVIDSFLGVGLNGEPRETAKAIISRINSRKGECISVDIPSGLPSEGDCNWECVRAEETITFAFPKLALLCPEFAPFTGELEVIDIGIPEADYAGFESSWYYLQEKDVFGFHKKFNRFSHKGDFGKVLMIAGSQGKMGAAVLGTKAALRTGSGLVTCLVPEEAQGSLLGLVPEAMTISESSAQDFSRFDAIGIGPGFGLDKKDLLELVLDYFPNPVVLDADALTLLSRYRDLIPKIPKGSILTPHLGEFERLFGKSKNHLDRLEKASSFCQDQSLNLVIKGANSVLCFADGRKIFNSSGSPYMASAGMGDVLTGMLTSFLGQGYSPEQALICGVFQHGLAGEMAGREKLRSTLATDLIEKIPETFKKLRVF